MTSKLSSVLWSAGGLLVTLLIAWYFSRNNTGVAVSADGSNTGEPSITFGGTTIAPVTVTGGSGGSNAGGSCCQRCADSSSISAGKVLQSGDFTQSVVAATHAAVNSAMINPKTATSSGVPIGPNLIAQNNGGMPLPSESWWKNDPLYAQAYVISYNQTVSQLMQMLMQQKRCGGQHVGAFGVVSSTGGCLSQMPMDYANDATPNRAIALAEKDGAAQLARGGNDTRWLNEAQNNSRLMLSTMQQTLNQWLSKLGDKNVAGGDLNLPPDQNVSQFLIN